MEELEYQGEDPRSMADEETAMEMVERTIDEINEEVVE